MNAFKCDICGKYYDANIKSDDIEIKKGISVVFKNNCRSNKRVDICKSCTDIFAEYINTAYKMCKNTEEENEESEE